MFKLIVICYIAFYNPLDIIQPKASWYGPGFEGKITANGEVYSQEKLTAASPYLPFNTLVKVTNLLNDSTVTVRINDRGPYKVDTLGKYQPHPTRYLDLSKAAFDSIADLSTGVIKIEYEILN